jgi:hypothetical protein
MRPSCRGRAEMMHVMLQRQQCFLPVHILQF